MSTQLEIKGEFLISIAFTLIECLCTLDITTTIFSYHIAMQKIYTTLFMYINE